MSDTSDATADIKADIEKTRAELADTVDSLTAKLDVKAQAKHRVQEVEQRAAQGYEQAKAKAPEPVRQAIGTVEQAARPLAAKATQDKQRTAMVAGGVVVLLVIVRRVRRVRRSRRRSALTP